MDGSPRATKFQVYQNIYFKISLGILALGAILFGIGWIFANHVDPAPAILILLAVFFMYYHIAHVLYGIGSLIYFISKIKNKIKDVKAVKTVIAILLSPISYIIFYAATILLAMTQCASD